MESQEYTEAIVAGMENYFRSFALADNMQHHSCEIEWIAPLPRTAGPALVFRIDLDEKTANQRLDELVPAIQAGEVPDLWVISPISTPGNLLDLLLSKGFQNLLDPHHPEPEPGMALDLSRTPALVTGNPNVQVIQVNSITEFAVWVDVVNEALHGWPMLTPDHYARWITCPEMMFFLAYLDGVPAATISTIQDRDKASLEFVSTLKAYRNRGVATTICLEALRALMGKVVRTVTLRSSYEAVPLYKKLGFQSYYEQILVSYPL